MKIPSKLALICALAVFAGLAAAGPASACYSHCVLDFTGCGVCEEAGFFTGYHCYMKRPCQCEEIPGVCAYPGPDDPIAASAEPVSLEELGIFAEPEAVECATPVVALTP